MSESRQAGTSKEELFVGRTRELEQWQEVLTSPDGQAVLVVGQEGMGKTLLLKRMARTAEDHLDLKCGTIRYEVTRTDSVDSILALIQDHAYEAAQVAEPSLSGTERRLNQWRALLNVLKIGELVMSLRRDPQRNSRDQFLNLLETVSRHMPNDNRAVFLMDPEKYMQPGSHEAWKIVIERLPDKIKLVFAQRPEDALATSREVASCSNCARIPDEELLVLDEEAVEELLRLRAPELQIPLPELREAVARYRRHPYALSAALDLVKAGIPIEEVPNDPTGIARAQWKRVCATEAEAGDLFIAYALLEVAVPDDVARATSGLAVGVWRHLLADDYLSGLLREEPDGWRIYHVLLADHIRGEMGPNEARPYHQRAMGLFRRRLRAGRRPDRLSAQRLPEHVLALEGPDAFADSFANECGQALVTLGFLDHFVSMAERALAMVEPASIREAQLLCNLGIVHQKRGELAKAETMYCKSLRICEDHDRRGDMASNYHNLGAIHAMRGELDEAEAMYRKSLGINERLGRPEATVLDYIGLGIVYTHRGALKRAEEMYRKSLAAGGDRQPSEAVASALGNLGAVYLVRGDESRAEEMLCKALEENQSLGRLEGIAHQYSNLGALSQRRGEPDKARSFWTKALDLYAQMGMLHMVEKVQGCLDEMPTEEGQ